MRCSWAIVLLLILCLVLLVPLPTSAATSTKGVLFAPSADLHALIYVAPLVRGDTWLIDPARVVWLSGTAWITDDSGRVVLAGHTPGAFEHVARLRVGDVITITDMNAGMIEQYEVIETVLTGNYDLRWIMPTSDEHVTLITCEGDLRRIVDTVRLN